MAALKTQPNDADVDAFLAAVTHQGRREDCHELLKLMEEVTGSPAKMWGTSIVGFGSYRYHYASGRNGEWFLAGFAPRKQSLTLYLMSGFEDYDELLGRLGKHKTGKSCLYINRLEQVDREVLHELVTKSVAHMRLQDDGSATE